MPRKRPYKKELCIDFDGVIHSYSSGFKGMDNIPDAPVEGAFEWLALLQADSSFGVNIYSSRSKDPAGVTAMKEWFEKHSASCPELDISALKFPTQKPAAWITIDDRAHHFQGIFPSLDQLANFEPWHKRNKTKDLWEDRYRITDKKELERRLAEDTKVISALGGNAGAFCPGIRIGTPGQGAIEVDTAAWHWLRPLLKELVERRSED